MSKPEPLDNVAHHDVRVIARYGADFGDNINQALVYPTEFLELQREYPIFFRQTESGAMQSVVLLGFDSHENLFLDGDRWNARYVPAMHSRGPCLIGFRETEADGEARREPMVLIDMENPRVSRTEGDPLFKPHGGNSPHLERISKALRSLHTGAQMSDTMFAAFAAAGLLAPLNLDLRLDEETVYSVRDLFTISADGLAQLDGVMLKRLNDDGFLALAFQVAASVGNVQRLMEMKNQRRTA
ncbi:MAG: SapC family protein [Asticcacaulis sp.]|nr:SapC family protein [Asticcacaulis sp.]